MCQRTSHVAVTLFPSLVTLMVLMLTGLGATKKLHVMLHTTLSFLQHYGYGEIGYC